MSRFFLILLVLLSLFMNESKCTQHTKFVNLLGLVPFYSGLLSLLIVCYCVEFIFYCFPFFMVVLCVICPLNV